MRGAYVVAAIASVAVWACGVLGPYGWFTDELYFLACAKRPALGYIDQPPLAPLLLAVVRAISDELWFVRIVPAAIYGASIVVCARLARQLGGGGFAQLLAAVLFATTPAILVIATFFSMNPLDVLIALALASTLLDLVQRDRPQQWLVAGMLIGIGFFNKHTVLVPAALFVLAALVSPARRHLATRWPYLGALVALLLASPNLVWLAHHDWITLDFYAVSTAAKNIETSPLDALGGQVLFVGPLGFVVALAGAVSLLRRPGLRGFGATLFVGLVAMMLASVSRPDRIVGLYPLALAAGAVAIERATATRRKLRVAGLAVYLLGSAIPLPIIMPLVPPATVARYSAELGVTPQLERQKAGAVPQWLADRLSWPELVAQVAAVVDRLPQRGNVVVLGHNYGIAGALEHLGPARGLTAPVISPHNTNWLWSAAVVSRFDADTVLVAVTERERLLRATFADVQHAGELRCEHCFEDGVPIWIARDPILPLALVWPATLHMQ